MCEITERDRIARTLLECVESSSSKALRGSKENWTESIHGDGVGAFDGFLTIFE
jgi:hypothetical protein